MIIDPKSAHVLTLVPNRRLHDLFLARAFKLDGETRVLVTPPLDVLSRWVEQTSAQIDLLQGRSVAASADRLRPDQIGQQAVSDPSAWTSAYEREALARSAKAAERLLRHWCPADEMPWESPDFHVWRKRVRSTLQSQGLFTPEDWLAHLQSQLDQAGELPLRLPAVIELHGFIEITRLEQDLFDALQRRGVEVKATDGERFKRAGSAADGPGGSVLGPGVGNRVLHAFDSASEEFRAAASWAKECLERGAGRVAVVVNGLDALASQLLPAFDRIVHPNDGMRVALNGDSLYHLADGGRLSEHAVIEDALLLLRLSVQGQNARHPFPDISRLLLSPCLDGWAIERQARARFEVLLRGEGRYYQTLRELRQSLTQSALSDQLPALAGLLAGADAIPDNGDMAQTLLSRLQRWGWPGPVARGSLQSGRVQQFTGLLERLRQADPGTAYEAINILSRWSQDTRLTERGGPLSPIQFLSPEDAVAQHFEAAWVMNVHDGNWPGHAAANPYLPQAMVRHVPRATPEGELEFTRRVQRHLDCLAPEVHYSWSRSGGDIPRLASPLLVDGVPLETGPPGPGHWPLLSNGDSPALEYPSGYAAHPWLQAVDDVQGLPLQSGEGARIPGGSSMFSHQSACPMMAYLQHRLQLEFKPMPGPFADYAFRGSLLHEALNQLYQEQVGKPGLPGSNGIAAAVGKAMQRRNAAQRLAPFAMRAEQQRLEILLQQWLAFERSRQGFVVAALEQRRDASLGGFGLGIRLDRVDRLDDGRLFIIDYKSGAVDAKGWTSTRMVEPQLPLYAVLLDIEEPGSVGGLALVSVRTGDCSMAGVADSDSSVWSKVYNVDKRGTAFGRSFATWADLFEHWKTGIDLLLKEITSGHAANCVYDDNGMRYSGLEAVLRQGEGTAWLLAHGVSRVGECDD